MKRLGWIAVASLTLVGLIADAGLAQGLTPEEALERSKVTGRPILAMAGLPTCGICTALKQRLQTDAALRPLLAQFIPLEMTANEAPWQTWARRFQGEGNTVPIVYIIRSDGEKLYARSGGLPGDELPRLLVQSLAKSGKILPEAPLKKLIAAVEKAEAAYEAGQIGEAVALLAPYAEVGSYAESAKKAEELAKKIADEGAAKVSRADEQLESDDEPLAGALALAEVLRDYKKAPAVFKAAKEVSGRHAKNPQRREIFVQSGLLDRARLYVAQGHPERAAPLYEQVLSKFPGTPAAEMARQQLEGAGAPSEGEKSDRTGEPSGKGGAAPSASEEKAASLLKSARALAADEPDRARRYAKRAIAAAPDSSVADDARELLAELDGE